MNNSTWLRSACIHIGGIESTLITTKLTTPQMNQVWHSLVTFLQSILYSTLNSVVYLPCPKLNCLMWTFFLCSDWLPGRATWTYIIGTGFPQWGKRQKRSKTSASEASPAVDWGGGNRPFSSPDFLSAPGRFFFLFFPHCEPDLRLGFPALVSQKSSLFGHIINPSLTSLFGQDGWTLASSLIPTLSRSIKQQKRTWPMTSYLDLRLDQ